MTRYRLAAVLLLIAAAQLALWYVLPDERLVGSRAADTVGEAAVALLTVYFLLRGSRLVFILLMVSAVGSAAATLVFALVGDRSAALQLASAFLNAAGAVLIWMIWSETARQRQQVEPG